MNKECKISINVVKLEHFELSILSIIIVVLMMTLYYNTEEFPQYDYRRIQYHTFAKLS